MKRRRKSGSVFFERAPVEFHYPVVALNTNQGGEATSVFRASFDFYLSP